MAVAALVSGHGGPGGGPASGVSFQPPALVFPAAQVGTRITRSVAVTNNGRTPTTITPASQFTYTRNAPTVTATVLSSSVNPSRAGQPVTFTATIRPITGTGTPTGTVTFLDGSARIGTAALSSGGTATITTATLSIGSHVVTASYGGDQNFTASTSPLTQAVIPAGGTQAATATALSSSANPSVPGQPVTYTATVSPVPDGGTVGFSDAGTPITGCGAQPVDAGIATCPVTNTSAGTHPVTAAYSGDPSFTASTGPLTQTVAVATTTILSSSANPSMTGQAVTFTARVSPVPKARTPTGTVTFVDDGSNMGTEPLNGDGTATIEVKSLAAGSLDIEAIYTGNQNFLASSASLTQIVSPATVPVP